MPEAMDLHDPQYNKFKEGPRDSLEEVSEGIAYLECLLNEAKEKHPEEDFQSTINILEDCRSAYASCLACLESAPSDDKFRCSIAKTVYHVIHAALNSLKIGCTNLTARFIKPKCPNSEPISLFENLSEILEDVGQEDDLRDVAQFVLDCALAEIDRLQWHIKAYIWAKQSPVFSYLINLFEVLSRQPTRTRIIHDRALSHAQTTYNI